MKQKILFTFLFLFLFSFAENLLGKGFFYLVESGNSKVYLFGSIHIAKSTAYPLDTIVESSFEACKNIVFEINLQNLDPFKLLEYGTFNDTNTLEKVIPQKYFKIVDSLFRKYGMPKLFYNKMQPWFAILLLINLELVSGVEDFTEGIDMYFIKKIDKNKNVLELESLTEQINVFKILYELSPEYFFEFFLNQMGQNRSSFDKTYDAWLKGDEEATLNEFSSMSEDSTLKKFQFILNDQRNHKMASKIADYIANGGTYFIVVGAAHLLGENGIVKILERKGFKVNKIL